MKNNVHDFSWQVCPNPECSMFKVKGAGNIKFHGHVGKNRDIHELVCRKCNKYFSEFTGTPYHRMRTPHDKILMVIKLLVEGNGIRGVERITGIHRDTVTRILLKTGSHLSEISDVFLADLKAHEIELDELWTFVKKKNPTRRHKT